MTDLPKPVGNTAKTSFPDLSASTASLCSYFKIRPPRRSDKRSGKILSLAAEYIFSIRSDQNMLAILVHRVTFDVSICYSFINCNNNVLTASYCLSTNPILRCWDGGEIFERLGYKRECSPSLLSCLLPSFPSALARFALALSSLA